MLRHAVQRLREAVHVADVAERLLPLVPVGADLTPVVETAQLLGPGLRGREHVPEQVGEQRVHVVVLAVDRVERLVDVEPAVGHTRLQGVDITLWEQLGRLRAQQRDEVVSGSAGAVAAAR